jgi:hypothetical protein
MIRVLLAAGLLALLATPAAAEGCLKYGKTVEMIGQVFAFEAFEGTETDTVKRLRNVDYYAMLLPEKMCFGKGKATLHNVTIVGLKGDAKLLAALAKAPVIVTGKLKNAGPEVDPQVVLTVKTIQPLKDE